MSDEVLCAIDAGVATVTLNRPGQRNAMNAALLASLRDLFETLDANRDVRVVVVMGAGPAFCSGMDLKEMEARGGAQSADPEHGVIEVLGRVERSRHPTIAMVHGDAIAGGCELALHCDLRVAADSARFAMPLARIGIAVPVALTWKLVDTIGAAATKELLFTGDPAGAETALALGLVNRVVAAADLGRAVDDLARQVAHNAPLSVRAMKAFVQRATEERRTWRRDDLLELFHAVQASADAREGLAAQCERRPPVFRGE